MTSSEPAFKTPTLNVKLASLLSELRRRLQRLYEDRLVAIVLYGSQARGDAEPGSDIDVMVVLKGPVQPCLEVERSGGILTEVSLQFDELVSCIFVNDQDFTGRKTPLLMNVRREGVRIS
jgi:uncharacterized protein